jgi:spore coat polysaccharide biosynthesis protein SpsF
MSQRVVAIIQARMKSSRLPDKVMLDLNGKSMLERVIERVSQARRLNQVVVATTSGPDEDPIAELCARQGIACYRGSLKDVLDRYYHAALEFNAGVVVRITADCPLIDPGLIDETVSVLLGEGQPAAVWKPQGDQVHYPPASAEGITWDFASTRLPPPWLRTFPLGLDVEVCTFAALQRAWQEAREQYEREHVLPYLYDQPNRFRCVIADWKEDFSRFRWTVDTAEDLDMMRIVYKHLESKPNFTWLDVLDLFKQHPELSDINAGVHHKDFREVDTRR